MDTLDRSASDLMGVSSVLFPRAIFFFVAGSSVKKDKSHIYSNISNSICKSVACNENCTEIVARTSACFSGESPSL